MIQRTPTPEQVRAQVATIWDDMVAIHATLDPPVHAVFWADIPECVRHAAITKSLPMLQTLSFLQQIAYDLVVIDGHECGESS